MPSNDSNNTHDLRRTTVRSVVWYGAALGALVGATWASVDASAVAVWGRRIPWSLPAIIFAAYVGAGAVVTMGLAFLCSIGRKPADGDLTGRVRHVCLAGCASVVAMIVTERVVHGGYRTDFGRSLDTWSLSAGIAVIAIGVVTAGLFTRWGRGDGFLRRVLFVALVVLMWRPFSELYEAPALGVVSFAANAVYCLLAVGAYVLAGRVARSLPHVVRAESTRRCIVSTWLVAGIGLSMSYGLLWIGADRPYVTHAAAESAVPPARSTVRPNVVLIVLDTVRADHLSTYGYHRETTPNLTRFAQQAVVYTNAVAPSSWTIPSHASMFTGLMPSEHGARIAAPPSSDGVKTFPRLAPAYETLAETLASHGYDTAAIVANLTVAREAGFAQGFRYYDNLERRGLDAAKARTLSPAPFLIKAVQRYILGFDPVGETYDFCRHAPQITTLACRWLDENRHEPYFLFVNYMDAHNPYHAHPSMRPQLVRSAERHDGPVDVRVPPPLRESVNRYDEELAYLDAHLGRLFDHLAATDALDDTLVIVASDHGESFGEHGYVGHCKSLYGEEIHVPMIVRHPRQTAARTNHSYTSLTSVHSLILEQAGVADRPGDRLTGTNDPSLVVAQLRRSAQEPELRVLIRPDGVKYIEDLVAGRREIYDLSSDPRETRDLSAQRADVAVWAAEWLDQWDRAARARRLSYDNSFALGRDLLEKLRSLGYVE